MPRDPLNDYQNPRVANRAPAIPDDISFYSSDWRDYGDEPTPTPLPDHGGRALMVELEPNKWAWLVEPEEAAGMLHLWPGQRESLVLPRVAAAVEAMQQQLAEQVYVPIRYSRIKHELGRPLIRRGWQFCPVLGKGSYVEWIDPDYAPLGDRIDWPKKPAARRPETRMAA